MFWAPRRIVYSVVRKPVSCCASRHLRVVSCATAALSSFRKGFRQSLCLLFVLVVVRLLPPLRFAAPKSVRIFYVLVGVFLVSYRVVLELVRTFGYEAGWVVEDLLAWHRECRGGVDAAMIDKCASGSLSLSLLSPAAVKDGESKSRVKCVF